MVERKGIHNSLGIMWMCILFGCTSLANAQSAIRNDTENVVYRGKTTRIERVSDLMLLVDKIQSNPMVFPQFINKLSSFLPPLEVPEGVMYAYLVELFSVYELDMVTEYSQIDIPQEMLLFGLGIIVDTNNSPLKPEQMPLIRDAYRAWLSENKDTPITVFRSNRRRSGSCIAKVGFHWR